MFRKISALIIVTVLIGALAVIPAMAAPYRDITISGGKNVIEAEWFDGGADNYAECTSPHSPQFAGRPDELVATEARDNSERDDQPDPNYNIGWTSEGDWVQYTVNFASAGTAYFSAWVASGDGSGIIDITVGGKTVQLNAAESNDWGAFVLAHANDTIDVEAGTAVIRTTYPVGGINVDALIIDFEAAQEPEPAEGEADNAQGADGDNGEEEPPAAAGGTSSSDDEDGNGMLLWIIIAAGAVIVIVIIIVLVTKKKK
jgi:hypothetical protein